MQWEANKKPLTEFLSNIFCSVTGVVQFQFDDYTLRVPNAVIEIKESGVNVFSDSNGEYWRLLPPGKHEIRARTDSGSFSSWYKVNIPTNCRELGKAAAELDFTLDMTNSDYEPDLDYNQLSPSERLIEILNQN